MLKLKEIVHEYTPIFTDRQKYFMERMKDEKKKILRNGINIQEG